MKEKIIVITGATAGIGFETALALAKMQANVIIVARNQEKINAACDQIKSLSGNDSVNGYAIDLSSQKQIRSGCRNILNDYAKIDVLINNAGIWLSKLTYSEDQIEMQFATNHLAPFLMTHLLLPALIKSDVPRIINISSDAHFHGRIHFDDLNLSKNYHGLKAYFQSKLANVLFTYEFNRRNHNQSLTINAVQPGLVKTNIGLKHTSPLHALVWKLRRMGGVSPAKGAATSVYLASSDESKSMSGKYWDQCQVKASSKASYNIDDAKRLWEISEKLCNITGYFEPEA